MRYALALVCGTVVLLSLVSLNAAPGNAGSGWQPRVQALESEVGALQADNADLRAQLDDLKDLLMHFSRNGNDVLIEGANVHVTNGLGSTDTINGLGNIIIGYNEERDRRDADFAHSVLSGYGEDWAMLDAEVRERITREEMRTAAFSEQNDRSGSHVLVVGTRLNYSSFGGIVTGDTNSTSGQWSSVLGGALNEASGRLSVVASGLQNEASGSFSIAAGGLVNKASGIDSVAAGGIGNEANGSTSVVAGGVRNEANGCDSVVAGGSFNNASGIESVVVGGHTNEASGIRSVVAGGIFNEASGNRSTVAGGESNLAEGQASLVSEGCNRTVMTCGGP